MNLFDDSNWKEASEYPENTRKKVLRDQNGAKSVLLELPAGFYMSSHSHITAEQHVILEGEYTSEGIVYGKGTYQKFDPHQNHGPFESKHGALVLVIWDPYPSKQ